MRKIALLLLLSACGCDNGHPPARPHARTEAQSTPAPQPAPVAPSTNGANAMFDAPATPPPDEAGVAGLSPAQRRAWELGYRDCSQGRYAPDNHLEAYRIGCGAAHDRMEGPRR